MNKKLIIILIAFVLLSICGFVGYTIVKVIMDYTKVISVDNYEKCAAAGGAILESYPEQCLINGKTFTRELTQEEKDRLLPPKDTSDSQVFYGSSTKGICASNSDCIPMGCNSEICGSKLEGDQASICIAPEQPLPQNLGYSCNCVQQQCKWSK